MQRVALAWEGLGLVFDMPVAMPIALAAQKTIGVAELLCKTRTCLHGKNGKVGALWLCVLRFKYFNFKNSKLEAALSESQGSGVRTDIFFQAPRSPNPQL